MTPDEIQQVAADALALLPGLLYEILPGGRMQGREYSCADLTGGAGDSCKVNSTTGRWADFATGEAGGDVVSLLAAVRRCSQSEAATELAERMGSAPPATTRKRPEPAQVWRPVLPVPTDAPPPPGTHPRHGAPSMQWQYRNQDGDLLGLVYRFDKPAGGKEVIPATFCSSANRKEWRWQSLPEPRPLYGLETLGESRHIVNVEGERAADAGGRLLGGKFPVVTWPGGSNAVAKADWRPLAGRSVAIWPDADAPGIKAALAVADELGRIGCSVKIVEPPEGVAKGWDLADAEAEGWTEQSVRDALKAALLVEDFRAKYAAEPMPSTVPEEENPAGVESGGEKGKALAARLRRGSDLAALDIHIEWVVNDLIPQGAVVLFFGRGGIGKTTLMMQVLDAISRGAEIFGRGTTQRPVICVDYENSLAVLAERCRNIGADNVLFLDSGSNPPRLDRGECSQYLDLLEQYPGAVFVFDTLRSSQGGDENDSQAMTKVMDFLRRLRDAGSTVIVLHHTPKASDRKYKGSGAIFDMCDHVLALYPVRAPGDDGEADDDDDAPKVYRFGTSQKTRYEPDRIFLTFDAETRCFVPAPDPGDIHMDAIADAIAAITDLDDVPTQKRIIDTLAGVVPKNKIPTLLKRGEGERWTVGSGRKNALIYTLLNPAPQFPTPIYTRETGEQKTDTPNHSRTGEKTESQNTDFTLFSCSPDLPNAVGEQDVLALAADDFEGGLFDEV